ncbi:DUF397 domain-containing protein [Actinomadura parmotrematis]|uniref:DUF397 domain-containing protein n=1 Tax=Actinomadura parmotrematis TaxID=2864039 RepID=A0ABS7FM10_9ACTN|nr:DUF397 domain-containing protein [Actinomadura parmotrematis]MBW8481399.1 DUF397 domain-containing protein [Actinomadura parmotrematis]
MINWRKSSHSGGLNDDACVELADLASGVGVRDSRNPAGPRLEFDRAIFDRLLRAVKRGDLAS